MKPFVIFALILTLFLGFFYYYNNNAPEVREQLTGQEPTYTVFVGDQAVKVTVANTPEERAQGLSGTTGLGEREGKLFIFEEPGLYGFWMKDMSYPIDIMWISNSLRVIHIESNVSPDTFPDKFVSESPARFVLETPAFFADTYRIQVGNSVVLPTEILPDDVQLNY